MFVDVIIPTFNRAQYLDRAVQSVLSQTYKDFKLHIVDDGSTDETSSVLEKYEKHPQVVIHRHENRGVSAARNFAVTKSTHEWISFLDSDDDLTQPVFSQSEDHELAPIGETTEEKDVSNFFLISFSHK